MGKLSLNVPELPINKRVLIEASAGTGKTYTIGLIVLRLLLEKLLPVEKIVLITFTEAATAELKKNSSEKILKAYDIWKYGPKENDDLILTEIIKNAQKENPQIKEVNLQAAIARIDEMPVFTIHGFCKRLLSEFAYETGNFEEKEVVTNTNDIKSRVVADFWRTEVQNLDEAIELTPNDLSKSINDVLNHPLAELNADDEEKKNAEKKLKYAIAYKLAREVRGKLSEEKRKLKIIDFDDMIKNCYDAVIHDKKNILQNAVKNKYGAILVDEFQDTDKMQFEIFDYLFDGKPFFMIGDPKQAIYRFRGGDISTYNKAKKSTGKDPVPMNVNYRSEKSLLDALNLFFEADSFKEKMGEGIDYNPVECGKPELEPHRNKDGKYQSFVIWKGQEKQNKEQFEPKAQRAVIEEIKRLLSTGNFEPKNIAILLDSNKDCLDYKNALAKENIPAIVKGASVFSSEAANFLRILLNAICYRNNIKRIRALLTNNFVGFEPKEITDKIFMEWINAIYETKTKWEKNGIMIAIDFFMTKLNLWGHIAKGINSERNITNIRQIMELLNEEEIKFGRIPEKINNNFSILCEEAENNEEVEEKLETDEDALKIMTIHKSKGLQFDIVFIPDIGRNPRSHKFPHTYMYHDKDNGYKETIVYAAESEKAKKLNNKEENEEIARLLYVALTRAKYRLYVAHNPCYTRSKSYLREIFDNFCNSNKSSDIQIVDLEEIFEKKYECNNIETVEIEKISKALPSKITPSWSKTSFTGISKSLQKPEHEYKEPDSATQQAEPKIPAGKRMGTLLHGIFENLDFDASESDIRDIVENKLGSFKEFSGDEDKEKARKDLVEKWVKRILEKELPGGAGKLCDIETSNKVAELNFFMNSKTINLKKMKEIMKNKIIPEKEELPDEYISGAIDLVFLGNDEKYYILDWKSNSLNDFSQAGMEEAMLNHGYHLQYYIYAVALKRWLEQTHKNFDFGKQFGGAYYIFIRGVSEENHDGIYFADGESIADSIVELDECFKGA